jgi:hypothetical protein
MRDESTLQLTFRASDELSVFDLGEYLTRFAWLYEAALVVVESKPVEEVLFRQAHFVKEARAELKRLAARPSLLRPLDGDRPALLCTRIEYASPPKFFLKGQVAALALAVILAGGKIDVFGVHVQIDKPLGEAVKELRIAFDPAAPVATPQAPPPTAAAKSRSTTDRHADVTTKRPVKKMKTIRFKK